MKNQTQLTVLAAFGLIVLIGGINFVAVRFSNVELAPFWGASLRFAVASLILFVVVFLKHLPLPKGLALIGAVLYGILGFGASYAFAYVALLQISAGLAAVIMSLVPLLTFFLAFLHGLEKIKLRMIIGALIAASGVAILFSKQLGINAPILYLLAMLAAAVTVAETGVVVKKFPKSHPLVTNAIGMGTGAVILLILAVIFRESLLIPTLFSTWAALFYLVFIGSISMFMLYLFVLNRWTASAASYTFVLTPIVAVLVATWLEKASVSPFFLISSALVLAGVYIGALGPLRSVES
ncbi:MAG TPA: EamA family transporter [Candidatus Limnocylindrales bacterium]|nr:EamA family transporter [Candidatus Limnocylindrales bacterium]